MNPPDSARPGTWWHWMDGNISKGITADMEAMQAVGLRYATMFNTSYKIPRARSSSCPMSGVRCSITPFRKRIGSARVGPHNCGGWSLSGGLWVAPKMSMQKITASRIEIVGGNKQSVRLPQPKITKQTKGWGKQQSIDPYYRDIAVFALKLPEGESFIDASFTRISVVRQTRRCRSG